MAFSHTFKREWNSGGRAIAAEKTLTGTGQGPSVDETIGDPVTDKLVVWTADISQLVGLMMLSDQDLTIETNDGSSPGDTINLKAGIMLDWHTDTYFPKPLSVDVTALYVTNASGSEARLQIESVLDATP